MKKKAALLAMICLIAASGCGGNNNPAPSDTTATTTTAKSSEEIVTSVDENGTVSQVIKAPEREDTTEQALAYLDSMAPAFRRYLDIRRTIPLTFETTITHDNMEWKTGIYIKDDHHSATYSIDPSGNEIIVIYDADTVYHIEPKKKVIYVYESGEEYVVKGIQETALAKIYIDDVTASTYRTETPAEYEGKEYDLVAISDDDYTVTHYFDMETGKLAYSVDDESVTRVDKLENSVTNEDIFVIPEDYERRTFQDLINEQLAEQQAAAESAQATAESTQATE